VGNHADAAAHFRSKEDLQVATIDAAAEMFDREVRDRRVIVGPLPL
jgi:hypothetical protein